MIPEYLNRNLSDDQRKLYEPIYAKIQESISNIGGIYNDMQNKFYLLRMGFNFLIQGYSKIEFIKPMPQIFFEIVDSQILNARATSNDGFYMILIYKGILEEIDVFVDSAEKDENFKTFKQANDNQTYGLRLKNLIHQILIEHELSHILNGHLDYLNELNSTKAISESNTEQTSNIEVNAIIQTMEMDADCTALSRLYAWLNQHSIMNHKDSNYFANREETFSDLLAAFYLLNKFYFDLSSFNKEMGTQKSLTPKERTSLAFHNMVANIEHYKYEVNLESLIEKFINKLFFLEEWFNKEQGVPFNQELLKNEIFQQTEMNKLTLLKWKEIRPNLLKYNYIKLVDEIKNEA